MKSIIKGEKQSMKKGRKLLLTFIFSICFITSMGNKTQIFAASGSQGYAVFRDGVVEYSYEWHNYKIGGGTNWDITANTKAARDAHDMLAITPKTQAQSLMAQVQSKLPEK